jgi:hypothetical protein
MNPIFDEKCGLINPPRQQRMFMERTEVTAIIIYRPKGYAIITLIRCQVNGSNGSFHGVMHSLSLTQQTFHAAHPCPLRATLELLLQGFPLFIHPPETIMIIWCMEGGRERERGREREMLFKWKALDCIYSAMTGHITRKHGH